MRLPLLTAAFALTLLVPATARADDYDDAVGRSRSAAERGDLAAAADALQGVVDAYPQDYAIALELAELELRRGRPVVAERAFRLAIARSPRAEGARAGLALALARQGRCSEADAEARAATSVDPASRAGSLVAACGRPPPPALVLGPLVPPPPPEPRTTLALSLSEHLFPSHPFKSSGTGAAVALDVPYRGWSFGATGRYTKLSTRDEAILPAFAQEEGFARVGYGTATWGVSLVGALVHDGSGKLGTSKHVGATLRLSPGGDLVLSVSESVYDDLNFFRVEPAYRFALGASVHLTPAVALQRADGQTYVTPSLTLSVDGQQGSLWAGAKVGEEVRPAYLLHSVVYAMPEHIAWGGFLGGRVRISDAVSIQASYALDRLEGTSGPTAVSSFLHSFSLGPIFSF